MKKVMVTGNLGYIGPVLIENLKHEGFYTVGIDSGLYINNFLKEYHCPDIQILKDIREIQISDMIDIDFVIHLAGLSNDPLGSFDESLTYEINYHATVNLAKLAKSAGVKRFIYASSQSVYGLSDKDDYLTEDSITNPLTAYAKSKLMSEETIIELADSEFSCTILRPATAFGSSPNFRYDIVANGFVTDAIYQGIITVKSDGSPWRPLSHVKDISRAFLACLVAPTTIINKQIFNVGTNNNNYRVVDILDFVKQIIDADVVFTNEHIDSRSYKVSSDKILRILGDYYSPVMDLSTGIEEIRDFIVNLELEDPLLISKNSSRLISLKSQIRLGLIDNKLIKIK
jgi:nucleoside-diphosphate-sugar epimerase